MTRIARRLSSLLGRRPVEEEVENELAFHLEIVQRDLIARGMTPDAARAEALRRFGDIPSVRAACERLGRQREQQRSRAELLGELGHDVRFGLRQLGRSRGFAGTAIATLVVGIAAMSTVFSVLEAVALRPLPFADPDRVVRIVPTRRGSPLDAGAGVELAVLRGLDRAFVQVGATAGSNGFTLSGGSTPIVVAGSRVTADYLRVFGVHPMLGRGFSDDDDRPGAPHVAVLSHQFWVQQFAGDSSIIGRSMTLDGEPYTVVGVMSASFDLRRYGESFWIPLRLSQEQLGTFGHRFLLLFARLRPDVSRAAAAQAASAVARELATRDPEHPVESAMEIRPYIDDFVKDSGRRLFVLLGAVSFVMLIACANVANLLLARGTARMQELAIRAALGAGRGRLVRQLLVESLALAGVSAILGTGVALLLVKWLATAGPRSVPRLDHATIDASVLAFTACLTVLTSVLVGLVPALRISAPQLEATLRAGGRSTRLAGAGRRDPLRSLFVSAEVALAMALLTGSGLLIQTAVAAERVQPGFDPKGVLVGRVIPSARGYTDAAAIVGAYERIYETLKQLPDVRSAALTSLVPLSGGGSAQTGVDPQDHHMPEADQPNVDFRLVSAGYLPTMRIPLLSGRDISLTDRSTTPSVAVISQSLAEKLWPGQNAVGRRIDALGTEPGHPHWLEVIGVAGDVHDLSLTQPPVPTLYAPFTQTPAVLWPAIQRSLFIVARTNGSPTAVISSVRRALHEVDPSLPMDDGQRLEDLVARSMATTRFNTLLLSVLGAIALALAAGGVYGVVAYFVSQRRHEIGLRMALGAGPLDVWRLVLHRGLGPVAAGAVVGGILSVFTARLLRGQLYGVQPSDPGTVLMAIALLGVVSLVAMLLPARQAMRVAPAVALSGG